MLVCAAFGAKAGISHGCTGFAVFLATLPTVKISRYVETRGCVSVFSRHCGKHTRGFDSGQARIVPLPYSSDHSPSHFTCPPSPPPPAAQLLIIPQLCLEHRHSYVRRNAALLCYYVHKNFGQQVSHKQAKPREKQVQRRTTNEREGHWRGRVAKFGVHSFGFCGRRMGCG